MRMIGFQGRYIDPILTGRKTMTLRRAGARGLPRDGETVNLRCRYDLPPFAQAVVDSVSPITVDDLTDADAHMDGHVDLASLRAAVADLYGDADLVCVRFTLVTTPLAPVVEPAQSTLF